MAAQGQPDSDDPIRKALRARSDRAEEFRRNPQIMYDVLRGILSEMEKSNVRGSDKDFHKAWNELQRLLGDFVGPSRSPGRTPIPPDVGNELAGRLLEIWNKRRGFSSVVGNYDLEVAAQYGSTKKVQEELLAALHGNDKDRQERALFGLVRENPWIGNAAIFDALESLYGREGVNDMFVLAVMHRIDQARALPHYEKIIDSTQDPVHFYKASSSANRYKSKDLLERILRRTPMIPMEGRERLPGLLNIEPKLLLGYISDSEGRNLEMALAAFPESHLSLRDGFPILVSKLRSKDPVSRLAVIRCLNGMAKRGTWADGNTLQALKEHASIETDVQTKKEALEGAAWLQQQLSIREKFGP